MLKLLFTTEDNLHQLTVVTDGIDGQLNVFVTENTIGDIDYFNSIGLVIRVGSTYNINSFVDLCHSHRIVLKGYPEGLFDKEIVFADILNEELRYELETQEDTLNFSAEGGKIRLLLLHINSYL